ncbi:hypothetical protein MMC07_004102 [Pseudocyphellaria aurata]|nr:hypothetical protein [Pseudocyphellaria aurata]
MSVFSKPLLLTLVPCVSLAYGIQGLVAVPSIAAHTERYYDLSGSLTYLSCTALSLALPVIRAKRSGAVAGWRSALMGKAAGAVRWDWRQVALGAAVGVWATRLGTHLYARISSSGSDSRFDAIRDSVPKFGLAFFAQATWVSICLLPVLALNSIPAARLAATVLPRSVAVTDALGLLLFGGGLTLEVLADRQKSAWLQAKREGKHHEDFLASGLWARSRHPNYFGETMLWSGIAVLAGGVLTRSAGVAGMLGMKPGAAVGWRGRLLGLMLAGASPAFVATLLLFGSGVPLSEAKYDQRYGDREDYRRWKRETPVFWPKLR